VYKRQVPCKLTAPTPVSADIGIGQTTFTNNLPPGGLRVGLLTNNISVFVQALESVTNTTVLANPKVLSLDKQKGYVHVGRSDGYQTTTVSSTTSTQTVQFLDSGTTLAFRPYIGDDGYIRMEIHPEDSSGGLTAANLPFKTTTEVTTNMMVKDGRTIVIGGLFRDASTITRGQVPLLGSIPFLGVLFRQQQDQTTRQEIIILLTPHVIKDDSAYSQLSEEQMKRAEDLRVGTRKGMMFFGRERLAESAYENAVAEMSKPNPDKNLVLWHLDMATNLNPTFLEAIELKEKVSGKRVTDSDNSIIRHFVSDSIISGMGRPAHALKFEHRRDADATGDKKNRFFFACILHPERHIRLRLRRRGAYTQSKSRCKQAVERCPRQCAGRPGQRSVQERQSR